ncbi:TlpA family protein disulfide reductase [Seonamhaeicola maritimus]|uniref:TlpA family protein disulfide reductase n=1 Tax=Seonamhaeicola maritimus TaxID=2591822 RepID=UPI002495491E|nr:hypothetical protein [Seonamhaeicola maritimus]
METNVTERHINGIQLNATDTFNSEFISAFNIQGIPRFILLDPEGTIVQANAARPSNPDLIKLFNEIGI